MNLRSNKGLLAGQGASQSSFWLDQRALEGEASLSDMIRLVSYRRAIANFCKIVTGKDIPVEWSGDQSYTDGQHINLAVDLNASTFDVSVGLALHEASHISLTDFELGKAVHQALSGIVDNTHPQCNLLSRVLLTSNRLQTAYERVTHSFLPEYNRREFIYGLFNWVEDRRIDHHIFSTSPGYKGYYHKLYQQYWDLPEVKQAMFSVSLRNPYTLQSWTFHIYNLISRYSQLNALSGLHKIAKILDLTNCSRWTSTADCLSTTLDVVDQIVTEIESLPPMPKDIQSQTSKPSDNQKQIDQATKQDKTSNGGAGGKKDEATQESEDPKDGSEPQAQDKDGSEPQAQDNDHQDLDSQLHDGDPNKEYELLQALKDFVQGRVKIQPVKAGKNKGGVKKLNPTQRRRLITELSRLENQQIEMTEIQFEGGSKPASVIVQDYTGPEISRYGALLEETNKLQYKDRKGKDAELNELTTRISRIHRAVYPNKTYQEAVQKGLEIGGLLGRKLLRHKELNELVTNRLRTGKIDPRRIAHAGYGIESIFDQRTIQTHRPAHLHMTIDASSSMGGDRWTAAIQTAVAIAKAISTAPGITMTIDVRLSYGEIHVFKIYDSRINKLNHLVNVLVFVQPNGGTPEGLCFEAMLKLNKYVFGDQRKDSYWINLSDGEPGHNGYSGLVAYQHTATQVNTLRQRNIKVLSYFIDKHNHVPSSFKAMYGSSAVAADCNSLIELASTVNKLLMSN